MAPLRVKAGLSKGRLFLFGQYKLTNGVGNAVFIIRTRFVIGRSFYLRDRIPHGDSATRPFDHGHVVSVVSNTHHFFLRDA